MKIEIRENERIDDLEYDNLKIIQNKNWFCFGIDSVLLSDFGKEIKDKSNVIDFGTGTGIIGILLCKKTKLKKIYGVEIQENVAEMAQRSILLNNLQDKFEIVNENIKNIDKTLEKNYFDAIVTNPPYKKENTGLINDKKEQYIARHEIECNLEDIISQTYKLLKNNGEFYMIHRAERIVDILYLLRKYKLEPKKIRFVHSKVNMSPEFILVKAVKNAKEFLKIEKPLYIYNDDGKYTEEILEIYNKK